MQLHNRDVRQDVRELGELLGNVLEGQTSRKSFETVESCRQTAIDYRAGDIDSRESLISELETLSPHQQRVVARAFTTYFELINLAEERERVRTIREASQEGTLEDSLETAAEQLGADDLETVQQVLDDVLIEPTFTAHPTEARRKTVKSKLRAIATDLETLDERLLTDKESEQVWRDIDSEVTSLWQTPQVRNRQPEPEDEARNVQWYLENTLFDVVGEVYDELADAIDEEVDGDLEIPKLFEFRSWAGSDRDGNPYVTPDVTANTLERQRSLVLERYREQLKRLSGVLSQDGSRIDAGSAFQATLEADRERLPGSAREARIATPANRTARNSSSCASASTASAMFAPAATKPSTNCSRISRSSRRVSRTTAAKASSPPMSIQFDGRSQRLASRWPVWTCANTSKNTPTPSLTPRG